MISKFADRGPPFDSPGPSASLTATGPALSEAQPSRRDVDRISRHMDANHSLRLAIVDDDEGARSAVARLLRDAARTGGAWTVVKPVDAAISAAHGSQARHVR